jgi:hypothetical protein
VGFAAGVVLADVHPGFARKPLLPLAVMVKWMPLLAIVLVLLIFSGWNPPTWAAFFVHLLFFFVAAFVCHSRLANDRPPASRLTEFYLWLSVGGMLGGVFNSLLAPVIFNSVAEYPIAIVLALLLRPRLANSEGKTNWSDLAWPVGVGVLTVVLAVVPIRWGLNQVQALACSLFLPSAIGYTFTRRPVRFALSLGAIMLSLSFSLQLHHGEILTTSRSFFGILRVSRNVEGDLNQFFHGNTKHGRQYLDANRRCEPLSYYHRQGPLGEALTAFSDQSTLSNVAVVGLGTGAMACYAKPGQTWTFYEIDPTVLAIAQNERYFSYLNCAGGTVSHMLGDARLQLRNAPDGHYSLIVLDAFSSDAIPTHLLTKEAIDLYLSKLAPGGRLLFHISNKYLNLRPVIAELAHTANLVSLEVGYDLRAQLANGGEGLDPSIWAIAARREQDFGSLLTNPHWQKSQRQSNSVWTDDYSNVLSALEWK